MRYIGHRDLTEEDREEAKRMRESFERSFGIKLTPISKDAKL